MSTKIMKGTLILNYFVSGIVFFVAYALYKGSVEFMKLSELERALVNDLDIRWFLIYFVYLLIFSGVMIVVSSTVNYNKQKKGR